MSESPSLILGPIIESGSERPPRILELDALRGIGALMILGFHLWPTTFFFGWTRADLFFVLSGYLVTSITLRSGPGFRPVLKFWARRALRILPAYYTMLAVVCVTMTARGDPPRLEVLISHLALVQHLPYYWSGTASQLSSTGQIWSLAIEVQFYLIWPMIVGLAGRSVLLPITLCLMGDAIAVRLLGLYPAVALARCDGLALGCFLALIQNPWGRSGRRSRWISPSLIVTGLFVLIFLSTPSFRIGSPIAGLLGCTSLSLFAVNMLYFSLIGLAVCHTGHRVLAPLRSQFLCYLGNLSYGIYLYNIIIIDFIHVDTANRTFLADVTAAALSVLVAAISWEFLERPMMNASKRFV